MSFTKSTTDISVHQKLGDYPNQDDGMTADELKEKFDFPAETLQEDINKIVGELESEDASQSIGANKLDESDETDSNVQAKLNKLYQEIRNTTLDQIPDGTITEEKMSSEYANSLAKKENLGLMYLSSKYNIPNIENETVSEYETPTNLTSSNTQGYEITTTGYPYFEGDVYTMLGGSGEDKMSGKWVSGVTDDGIVIKFPFLINIKSIIVSGINLGFKLYGSIDGNEYTLIHYQGKANENDTEAASGVINLKNVNYYQYIKILIYGWNDNTGYLYNNIKFSGTYISKEIPTITTPSLSSENKLEYSVSTNNTTNLGTIEDLYTMLGGDGEQYFKFWEGIYLLIEFPNYFKMTEYKMNFDGDNQILAFYGSNDGESYTHIENITTEENEYKFITLNNNDYYKYYKIVGVKTSAYALYVDNNIYFKGQEINTLKGNNLSIISQYESETLEDYIDGMIVKLKTPTNYIYGTNLTSQLKIYDLLERKIPSDLEPGKYYTLVYKNSEFMHESEV